MNKLTDLFCCPVCKIKLSQNLHCKKCKYTYAKKNGIYILLPPFLQQEYQSIKAIYEKEDVAKNFGTKEMYTGSVYYRQKLRKKAAQLIAKCTRQGATIADIGCGNGLLLKQIAQKRNDLQMIAVDFSYPMIKEAYLRLNGRGLFIVASVHALPFAAKSIDATCCIDVVKNLPKQDMVFKALEEIRRTTKKYSVIEFVVRTPFDRMISLVYTILRVFRLKKKVEKGPLSGISVNKVTSRKIASWLSMAGAKAKLYYVHPLLTWVIFFVRWRA